MAETLGEAITGSVADGDGNVGNGLDVVLGLDGELKGRSGLDGLRDGDAGDDGVGTGQEGDDSGDGELHFERLLGVEFFLVGKRELKILVGFYSCWLFACLLECW